jgi:hypothetical protein
LPSRRDHTSSGASYWHLPDSPSHTALRKFKGLLKDHLAMRGFKVGSIQIFEEAQQVKWKSAGGQKERD